MADDPINMDEYVPEANLDNMTIEEMKSSLRDAWAQLREQDEAANVPTADDVALAIIAGLCAQPADASQIAQVVQGAVALAWQVGVPQYMAERNNYIASLRADLSGGV